MRDLTRVDDVAGDDITLPAPPYTPLLLLRFNFFIDNKLTYKRG
jgi:hypothetical protein